VTIRFDAETFHARFLAALESARGLRGWRILWFDRQLASRSTVWM